MQETWVQSLGREDPRGEGNGNPLQKIPWMDGGAWWATVHGVTESWTRLSDLTFTFFHFHTQSHYTRTQLYVTEMNYNQLYYNCFFFPT